ncbi:MAG: c-type cytochrome [Bacillaceae bacterium]|nr:c-type cytochrome [Bacillaceae bacterium]
MANHDKDVKYVGDSRVVAEKHDGTPPSYSEFPGKSEPFWPDFLLKEWMVAAVGLVGFLVLTISHPAPIGDQADPNNTSFLPLPDWYFLFLYQFLKYPWASGDYVLVGTVIVPGLAFTALLLAPWLDRGPERRPNRRPVATTLMMLALVSIVYLTWAAVDSAASHKSANHQGGGGDTEDIPPVSEDASPGEKIWAKQASCIGCHAADMSGAGTVPGLTDVGSRLSAEEIKDVIVNGRGQMPGGMFQGTDEELDQLVEYLASLK